MLQYREEVSLHSSTVRAKKKTPNHKFTVLYSNCIKCEYLNCKEDTGSKGEAE